MSTIITVESYGQIETKLITKKRNGYSEQYEVIKKNKKIKHGSFVKFKIMSFTIQLEDPQSSFIQGTNNEIVVLEKGNFNNGKQNGHWEYFYNMKPWNKLKEEGSYQNGLKHGLWTSYWHDGTSNNTSTEQYGKAKNPDSIQFLVDFAKPKLKSRGVYYKGNKHGAWEYYNFDGSLVHKYDHSNGQLIFEGENSEIDSTHSSMFIGGEEHFNYFMLDNISWINHKDEPKSESVKFKITINEMGTITNIAQLTGHNNPSDFDEKIEQALENTNGLWIPEKVYGAYTQSTAFINATLSMKRHGESIFYQKKMSFTIDDE